MALAITPNKRELKNLMRWQERDRASSRNSSLESVVQQHNNSQHWGIDWNATLHKIDFLIAYNNSVSALGLLNPEERKLWQQHWESVNKFNELYYNNGVEARLEKNHGFLGKILSNAYNAVSQGLSYAGKIVGRTVSAAPGPIRYGAAASGLVGALLLTACDGKATPTPVPTNTPTPSPTANAQKPTPEPAPEPTLEPTPKPTPQKIYAVGEVPEHILTPGEIPKLISIDLKLVQYEPFKSYEAKLGNTNVSVKDIFERVYYELTGKTFEKVRNINGDLEERIRVFLLPSNEYAQHGLLPRTGGTIRTRGIETSERWKTTYGILSRVAGVNVYVETTDAEGNPLQVHEVVSTLAHELWGHGYSHLYEVPFVAFVATDVSKEAIPILRQVAFMRYLEAKYGLTAYIVSDTSENRRDIGNLVKMFGEVDTSPYGNSYTGIWAEVLNKDKWYNEVVKGKLSPQTLIEISNYLMEHPWRGTPSNTLNGVEKLDAQQQQKMGDALLARLVPDANYKGRAIFREFFLP